MIVSFIRGGASNREESLVLSLFYYTLKEDEGNMLSVQRQLKSEYDGNRVG